MYAKLYTGKDPRASTYKVDQIKSTAQTAYGYVLSGKTVGEEFFTPFCINLSSDSTIGANKYPHRYGYKDPHVKLASACKKTDKNLYEFPIIGNGKYKGEDTKNIPDRIVVKQKSKKEAIYCGLITHTVRSLIPLYESLQY